MTGQDDQMRALGIPEHTITTAHARHDQAAAWINDALLPALAATAPSAPIGAQMVASGSMQAKLAQLLAGPNPTAAAGDVILTLLHKYATALHKMANRQ